MHYTWQWSYTIYTLLALLLSFLLAGAALVFSPKRRRSPGGD